MTRPVRTIVVVLAAVTLGVLLRGVFVQQSQFDESDLVRFEQRPYGIDLPDRYVDTPFWLAWTRGDGQAYVTLAGDPLADREARGLGVPLYRFARVGYTWAGLVLVGGQVDLIPYGLFAVNVASLAVLGWIAARRLDHWGPRSLLLAVVPGAVIAMVTDTAEAMGIALAALAVTAGTVPSYLSAAVLGIVRPDFATALFLRGRRGLGLVGVCAATAIAIRVLGLMRGLEYAALNDNLTLPLLGYINVVGDQTPLTAGITLGLGFVAVMTIRRGIVDETGWLRLAPLTTGLFVLMLSPAVLGELVNSLRAAAALSLVWAVPEGATADEPRSVA